MAKPFFIKPVQISNWRYQNNASISETADHFGISIATVKRAERLVSDSKTLVQLWNDYVKKQGDIMREWQEQHRPTDPNHPAVKALNEFLRQVDSIPDRDIDADLDELETAIERLNSDDSNT